MARSYQIKKKSKTLLVAMGLIFWVVVGRSLFILLSFFFSFDIRLLITTLVFLTFPYIVIWSHMFRVNTLNAHLFSFLCCTIVCLRSEFRVVMSATISVYKRCSVRFYLQLFVVGLMSHYGFHSFPVVDWFCLFI